MTFNPGVLPVAEHLPATRGYTFRATVHFYEDEAQSKPLNLTGYTAQLLIEGWTTLTSGSGLTVNSGAGTIEVLLTQAQTAQAPSNQHRYVLNLEGGGEKVPPLVGYITFSNP